MELVRTPLEKYSNALAMFYRYDKNGHRIGVGSGFIVRYKGEVFLVTAYHVLDPQDGNAAGAVIANRQIDFANIPFKLLPDSDLAGVPLLAFDELRGITITAFEIRDEDSDVLRTEDHALMGFPASKNKSDSPRFKEGRMTVHLYMGLQPSDHIPARCTQDGTLGFLLDLHENWLTEERRADGPASRAEGVSGGPLIALVIDRLPGSEITTKVAVAGVFIEWDGKEKIGVAVRRDKFVDLLDLMVDQLKAFRATLP